MIAFACYLIAAAAMTVAFFSARRNARPAFTARPAPAAALVAAAPRAGYVRGIKRLYA